MAQLDSVQTVVIERPGEPTPRAATIDLVPLTPIQAILVRAARTALQAFIGSFGVGAVASVFVGTEFRDRLIAAGGVALAVGFVSLVQNSAELLARWDANNAAWRA